MISEVLGFDSQLFGFKVGRILPGKLLEASLCSALADLSAQGVKLVYWCTDDEDLKTDEVAKSQGGYLTDKKTTYVMDLPPFSHFSRGEHEILSWPKNQLPSADLYRLSRIVADRSRFAKDPHLDLLQRYAMYDAWIRNSCNRQIASEVWVEQDGEQIKGMVTMGQKSGRADIGLLAVSETYRGQGVGKRLLNSTQAFCAKQGFAQLQVVTQADNVGACRLYESCGFKLERIQNFYHFWLE